MLIKKSSKPVSNRQKLESKILKVIGKLGPNGEEVKNKVISSKLGIEPDSSKKRQFERALERLVKNGAIFRPYRGAYSIPNIEDAGPDNSDTVPEGSDSGMSENRDEVSSGNFPIGIADEPSPRVGM